MQNTKVFWFVFCIVLAGMTFLFALPTIRTHDAPTWDGVQLWGFPFTFWAIGGMCPEGLCSYFSLTKLVLDLAILVAIPLGTGIIASRLKK